MSYPKLSLTRADNGAVLEWHSGKDMQAHREVFVTSGALIDRIASLHNIFELDGLHVAPSTYSVPQLPPAIDLTQPEAAASVAVDEYLPDGTPRLEIGD
jgi:hypothetical protein